MKSSISLPMQWAALCALLLLSGCASAPFIPAKYSVSPDRPYKIATTKHVMLCPCFDRIAEEDRKGLDPKFSPASYLTGMIEAELVSSGIKPEQVTFAFAPSFEGLQTALADGSVKTEGAIVLASAINVIDGYRSPDSPTHSNATSYLSCDFKLYSSKGGLLFERRGLCINLRIVNDKIMESEKGMNFLSFSSDKPDPKAVENNLIFAQRMVMQQLFADPEFQKALQ